MMSDRARRRARELGALLSLAAAIAAVCAGLALTVRPHDRDPVLRLMSAAPAILGGASFGREVPIEDPSGHALDALHAALRRAARGAGQARLAFYGGSHMAGDTVTGRIRERLQERFGDAGHGFVPIVPVVTDHWAWGVRIDAAEGFEVVQVGRKHASVDRYGLAGAAFTGDEVDAFAAVTSEPWGNSRFASQLTLLYDRRPGGGTFEVELDGRVADVLAASAAQPEAATRRYPVSDGPHRLEVRLRGDGTGDALRRGDGARPAGRDRRQPRARRRQGAPPPPLGRGSVARLLRGAPAGPRRAGLRQQRARRRSPHARAARGAPARGGAPRPRGGAGRLVRADRTDRSAGASRGRVERRSAPGARDDHHAPARGARSRLRLLRHAGLHGRPRRGAALARARPAALARRSDAPQPRGVPALGRRADGGPARELRRVSDLLVHPRTAQ
ncbi:MAG: hypothetical protein M5U28_02315 [Sandaracinaceae bacterium]|nr:hypothetical protein [Sandaracinaceae bacterium]